MQRVADPHSSAGEHEPVLESALAVQSSPPIAPALILLLMLALPLEGEGELLPQAPVCEALPLKTST